MKRLKFSLFLMSFFTLFVLNKNAFAEEELNALVKSPDGLYHVLNNAQTNSDVLLFIHGIEGKHLMDNWKDGYSYAKSLNKDIYFIRWTKTETLEKNQETILKSMLEVVEKNQDKKIRIFAHSVGGVISLTVFNQVQKQFPNQEIILHTLASPVYGYGAPKIAAILKGYLGATTMSAAYGIFQEGDQTSLTNCHQWITTNCELDKHACMAKGTLKKVNPQTGYKNTTPICGSQVIYIDDEGHNSVILRVLKEEL